MKKKLENLARPAAVRESRRKADLLRERELEDVRLVLSSVRGRRFVYRYLERCGVYRLSFTQDPHLTAFYEGERNVGLKLLSDVNEAAPEMISIMAKEAKAEGDL